MGGFVDERIFQILFFEKFIQVAKYVNVAAARNWTVFFYWNIEKL